MLKLKIGIIILVAVVLAPVKIYSQAGGSAVPFLTIAPDARASGMGEVGVAVADNVNAIFWNPGGLGFLDYFDTGADLDEEADKKPFREVALSVSPWLPQFSTDLFYSYFTIGQYVPEIDGTAAFNFILMNLGEFTRTEANGTVLGKFTSNEFSAGLSYGTIVAPDLGVGFQLRYIQSNLTPTSGQNPGTSGTGVSVGFDLGILWKPKKLDIFGLDLEDRLSLGVNLQNVGPKVTYIKESDPLPTMLRMGAAYTVAKDEFNDLKFAFDFSKMLVYRDRLGSHTIPRSFVSAWQNPGVEFAIGTEYWYEKVVALRAGYFTEPAALGNRKFWNFGVGIKYDIFNVDFSFINAVDANSPLANTMRFSLLVDWM
jgi:long-subunit fatty acid transport protein